MDGETTRATITGICGAISVIGAALIASRTSVITASIALRQAELKEKEKTLESMRDEEEMSQEIEELRREVEELRRGRMKDSAKGKSNWLTKKPRR